MLNSRLRCVLEDAEGSPEMIFIKLLCVLALIAFFAVLFLLVPPTAAKRLSERGSKYQEIPVCFVTFCLTMDVIWYCVMKNTVFGFVAAWSSVYLFCCLLITLLRYHLGKRRYCREYYVKYEHNYVMIANIALVLVLVAAVAVTDQVSEKLPEAQEIEAVYFGYDALEKTNEDGLLSPEYAIIHSDTAADTVGEYTGLNLTPDEAAQFVENLKLTVTDIRTDENSFDELLNICDELDHSFFKQEFSRRLKISQIDNTSIDKTTNYYFYVTFRMTDGSIVSKRYEYGMHDIHISDNENDAAAGLASLQAMVESPDSTIQKAGVFYQMSGDFGEQPLSAEDYDEVLMLLQAEGVTASSERSDTSSERVCVYFTYDFAMPEIYKAYGVADRTETVYYSVVKANTKTWKYLWQAVNQ